MKYFNRATLALCICCALACAIGCGEPPAQDVDRVQSALVDPAYNTPITYPAHESGYPAPSLAMATGQEWAHNWTGGWIDQQEADNGTYRTRPNLGWPGRVAGLAFFRDDHLAMQSAVIENGGYFFQLSNDYSVRRQVMICSWDKRFPWSTGVLANKWCNQFPMYTTGNVNSVWKNQARLYVAEQGFTHAIIPGGPVPLHINDGIFQVSTLIMDQYVRCEVCSGANMTGSCKWFGYNCTDSITCSPTAGNKASQIDIRQWTGDASGNPFTSLSFKCEYGDATLGAHGVPPQPYYPG